MFRMIYREKPSILLRSLSHLTLSLSYQCKKNALQNKLHLEKKKNQTVYRTYSLDTEKYLRFQDCQSQKHTKIKAYLKLKYNERKKRSSFLDVI